jgi:iron complex outermembrane receptor protein
MRKTAVCLLGYLFSFYSYSQSEQADSSQTLGEVIIKAYEQNQKLRKFPAAVNQVNKNRLDRFNNISILPALNSTPGVKMEERSPGSYRMNIRGSTIRSPFGVRNVKIYRDGIPFTDPGGNTYLNQLSFFNFNTIEIIKGPAGSLYGAGTGGAILINSLPEQPVNGLQLNFIAGSYGLDALNVQLNQGNEKLRNHINIAHQQSNGYRDHTHMRRDVFTWHGQLAAGKKETLRLNFLYGDLYYQTPGALTKAEYQSNPKSARPKAGTFPSADSAKAAIYQKTFSIGLNNHYRFNDKLENTFVFYVAKSTVKNPTFRNYEARSEPHFGGRTFFTWKPHTGNVETNIVAGAEAQNGNFNIATYKNMYGKPGALLTNDDVNNSTWSVFAQADFRFRFDMNVTAGVSLNKSTIKIHRLSMPSLPEQKRTYDNEAAPRLAVSKKIFADFYLYGSVAKGFSPPTTAEVLPSTSVISTYLNAEHGVNYEAGFKTDAVKHRLYAEANVFYYKLEDAIVQRRDATNGDYFINAGSTKQKGIEAQASYVIMHKSKILRNTRIWIAYTRNNFTYDEFKQLTNDYSGNKLPGVAKNTFVTGVDVISNAGVYINITYNYSDPVFLNDANSEAAASYNLLSARLGWKKDWGKKKKLELFAGIENAFDVTYSLGNDFNAAGGRYYNAAPGRNFYGGVSLGIF